MTSILTNTAAMSALSSLTSTQLQLSTTQAQISSGLAVANASDNEAYWSIATTMKSQVSSIDSMGPAIGLGLAALNVASTALDAIIGSMSGMLSDLVTAQEAGADLSAIDKDLEEKQRYIGQAAATSSFNGVNLLAETYDGSGNVNNSSYKFVTGVSADGTASSFTVQNLFLVGSLSDETSDQQIDGHAVGILGRSTIVGTNLLPRESFYAGYTTFSPDIIEFSIKEASSDDIKTAYHYVSAVYETLIGYQGRLASATTLMTTMQSFNSSLSDALTSGIGSLVDADMNVASIRLQALQTQEQLGIQGLSMANQNSQLILKLFQAA